MPSAWNLRTSGIDLPIWPFRLPDAAPRPRLREPGRVTRKVVHRILLNLVTLKPQGLEYCAQYDENGCPVDITCIVFGEVCISQYDSRGCPALPAPPNCDYYTQELCDAGWDEKVS